MVNDTNATKFQIIKYQLIFIVKKIDLKKQ